MTLFAFFSLNPRKRALAKLWYKHNWCGIHDCELDWYGYETTYCDRCRSAERERRKVLKNDEKQVLIKLVGKEW